MTIGNTKPFFLLLCTAAMLSGCQEKRENPLHSKPNHEILNWIDKNKNAEVEACAQHWADPKTAPHSELVICEKVSKDLVDEMNYQGFVEGAIEKDLYLPVIWRELYKKFVVRAENLKSSAKSAAKLKNSPFYKRLEENKKQINATKAK